MNHLLIYPLAGRITDNDPHGLIITVVSVLVVFLSLLILFLAYLLVGKIVRTVERRRTRRERWRNITRPAGKTPVRSGFKNVSHIITIRRKGNESLLSISKKTADMTRGLLDIYGTEYESDLTTPSNTTDIQQSDTVASAGTMRSPLPGTIISINVKVGDKVSIGQEVAVLEAMKMENSIESEFEGTVTAIHISQGESILEGGNIITIG
jgi:biotin carboxyl carrier protein